jgi:hypothetical protein
MKIPRKITIGSRIFKIKKMARISNESEWGSMDWDAGIIQYADGKSKTRSGEKGKNKDIVIMHELTHAILETMGREDMSQDEGFVEAQAWLYLQVFKQLRG